MPHLLEPKPSILPNLAKLGFLCFCARLLLCFRRFSHLAQLAPGTQKAAPQDSGQAPQRPKTAAKSSSLLGWTSLKGYLALRTLRVFFNRENHCIVLWSKRARPAGRPAGQLHRHHRPLGTEALNGNTHHTHAGRWKATGTEEARIGDSVGGAPLLEPFWARRRPAPD